MTCVVKSHSDTQIVCDVPSTPLPGENDVKVCAAVT
jgi:hypothetical protein